MIEIRLAENGIAEAQIALLRSAEMLPKLLDGAMQEAVEFGQRATQEEIRTDDLLFRRALLNSIETQVLSEGTPIASKGFVYSELPYAEVMEDGRKPGKFPPRDAIEPWVAEKVMGGALGRAPKGTPEQQIRSMTFVISRAIAKKGIKGRKYFMRAGDRTKAAMPKFIEHAAEQLIEELGK